ncbi:ArnT family glycosyltransferase [Altericista sp. CCNU0014]|uniref:ArnT family glycosyltransferase n=1 Tax=Altericista sp. CCNU0014 TaxID=3082949 RepID=UPI00384BBC8C
MSKKYYLNYLKKNELAFVLLLCGIGILLRVILFGEIPPGLNQDEAAAGYEAYSLLLTGKDKWGNIWPAYFIAWGAGQNVLYSYLLIPVIHFFGLTVEAVRSVNLIFGILTIPLLYEFTKKTVSRKIACISTFLLAVSPWHVMLSRWGLESNLLPFFVLLGFYTVHRALSSKASLKERAFCLVPWAIALYAYGTFYFILFGIFLLLFKYYKPLILEKKSQWLISVIIFAITSLPILLFTVKNSIFRNGLFFEKYLPFSIPLLTSTPFRAINPQTNLEFIFNGFQDDKIWNRISGLPPIYMILFPFLCIGIKILLDEWKSKAKASLLLVWLFSCLPMVFISSLNINRANAVFIPVLVIAAIGFEGLLEGIKDIDLKKILKKIITIWVLVSSFLFVTNYFFFYSSTAAIAFNYGLENAFDRAITQSRLSEKILVTDRIKLPYVYALFFTQYPPADFQKDSQYSLDKDGIYNVRDFGRFYFDKNDPDLNRDRSFIFLQRVGEESLCNKNVILYSQNDWIVKRCFVNKTDDRQK